MDRAALEELTGTSALEAIRRQPWMYQHGSGALYIRRHGRYCVPTFFFNGLRAVWTRRDWVPPEAEAQPRAGRRHTAWQVYGGLAAFVAVALIAVR